MTWNGEAGGPFVNEGSDARFGRWLFAPIQRALSFQWGVEPFRLVLYFPPHVYLGVPLPGHRYLVVRAGLRHDRNWGAAGGYIADLSIKLSRNVPETPPIGA